MDKNGTYVAIASGIVIFFQFIQAPKLVFVLFL